MKRRAHSLLPAKGDHGARALVTQVPDLAARAGAGFPSGRLQSPIAAGAFPAPVAFPGDLPQAPYCAVA